MACLPTSLSDKGSILRPAVFEDSHGKHAPLLLSLPFLLHCRAVLHLDPDHGLFMHLRHFDQKVPLLIGPTGALRVPLHQFQGSMIQKFEQAMQQLEPSSSPEVMSLEPKPVSLGMQIASQCSGWELPHEAKPRHGDSLGHQLENDGAPGPCLVGALRARLPASDLGHPDRIEVLASGSSTADERSAQASKPGGPRTDEVDGRGADDEPQAGGRAKRRQRPADTQQPGILCPGGSCSVRDEPTSSVPLRSRGNGLEDSEDGENYQRTFYRCPKYKDTANRCNFFQWTPLQPFWHQTSMTPTFQMPLTEAQMHCRHLSATRQGSNGFMEQVKCKSCGLILNRQPKGMIEEVTNFQNK